MHLPAPARERVYSVDVLRGLVMIIMALDHVRDFFLPGGMTTDPLDPQTTYPALYITRWITHFCAPLFVFLSGVSVQLMNSRKTKGQISRFLLTRGLWLIFAELTIINFALTFDPMMRVMFLQVIWAIGICFVILSLLVYLPWQAILGLGILITISHNLLDFREAQEGYQASVFEQFAHKTQYTYFQLIPGHGVIVLYPFVPWLGIMLMGYGIGRLFREDISSATRKQALTVTGLLMTGLFFILRSINVYGDPLFWKPWPTMLQTVYSFMNVQKYPPSLLYTCATIGPGLLLLVLLEHARNRLTDIFKVYGSVPFFYYVLHFYIIHTLGTILFFVHGYGMDQMVDMRVPFAFRPADFGYPLPVVYLIWLAIVAVLYKPCKWFAQYKRTHRQWWLSYL